MRILVTSPEGFRRLANVDIQDRDGSIVLTLPRTGLREEALDGTESTPRTTPTTPQPRTRKITLHASGRINFAQGQSYRTIFTSPLVLTDSVLVVCCYRIPSLNRLDLLGRPVDDDDLVLDLSPNAQDKPVAIEVLLTPSGMSLDGEWFRLDYFRRFALVFRLVEIEERISSELVDHFVMLTPQRGPLETQALEEDRALILFHQVLVGSDGVLVYGPNGDGWYRLIFAVQMRVAPKVTIVAADPGLDTEVRDQSLDGRSNRAQVFFRFRNRRSRTIIRSATQIALIELDAEL